VVVPRALRSLYVAAESQRRQGRARGLAPRTPFHFFQNLPYVLPWGLWVKSGREETVFSNFGFDFHLSSGLGLEKKKSKEKKKKRKMYTQEDNERLTEKAQIKIMWKKFQTSFFF